MWAQNSIAQRISDALQADAAAQEARTFISEATGWQSLVLAEAAAYGPEAALADDAYNRSGALKMRDAVYA